MLRVQAPDAHPAAGRWLVRLLGAPPDIQRLAADLPGGDIRIFPLGGAFYLAAREFEHRRHAEDVAWTAIRVLDRLNSAVRLRFGCGAVYSVQVDAVYGFWPDGHRTVEEPAIPRYAVSIPLADILRVTAARPFLMLAVRCFAAGQGVAHLWKVYQASLDDLGPDAERWLRRERRRSQQLAKLPWTAYCYAEESERPVMPPPGQCEALSPSDAQAVVAELLERALADRLQEMQAATT